MLGFKITFLDVHFVDAVDILLVALLLYQMYRLVRKSVAVNIIAGLLFIYFFYLLVKSAGMELLSSILGQFIGVGVLAMVILFQQEIRQFLLMIGRTSMFNRKNVFSFLNNEETHEEGTVNINAIVKAAKELSSSFTGALIVFSRSSDLKHFINSGDLLDAVISKRLLITIFNKNSPLHDGAVIIEGGRIKAARCILPVTENPDLPAQYGLRHRSAIGITEHTDAIVLVVSEETGSMSIVHAGEISHNLTGHEIRAMLMDLLYAHSKPTEAVKTID